MARRCRCPPRHLMRIAEAQRRIEVDLDQRVGNSLLDAGETVNPHGLAQRVGGRPPRMERAIRVLKHHLNTSGAGAPVERVNGGAAEGDVPGGRHAEPGNRAQQRRLAAAGFADQTPRLAGGNGERHAIDGGADGGKADAKTADLDHAPSLSAADSRCRV